jgi:hypothetical protein
MAIVKDVANDRVVSLPKTAVSTESTTGAIVAGSYEANPSECRLIPSGQVYTHANAKHPSLRVSFIAFGLPVGY